MSSQLGEQMFVYILLATVTLPPESYFLIKGAIGQHLVGECLLTPGSSRVYGSSVSPGTNTPWTMVERIVIHKSEFISRQKKSVQWLTV